MIHNKNTEEIISLLEKIIDKSADINKFKDKVPQIEIDFILQDIRKLYDLYYHLNDIENSELYADAVNRNEKVKNSSNTDREEKKSLKIHQDESSEPQLAKNTETAEANTQNLSFTTNQVIADKFKDDTNSIHSKIAQNKQDTPNIISKVSDHQLTDIRKGIGLNEKILFIKELFKGNLDDYDDSLNKLNSQISYAEAMEYFSSKQKHYNWDEKSDAFLTFKNLIERKYTSC